MDTTNTIMSEINSVAFSLSNYKDPDDMWQDIAQFLRILTANRYIATVEHEDCGIYVIRYNHHPDRGFGNTIPMWVTFDESEIIYDYRTREEKDGLSFLAEQGF